MDIFSYIEGMKKPDTRDAAIADGSLTYFTGTPCAHGHIADRYVVGYACTRCVAAAGRRNEANRKRPAGAKSAAMLARLSRLEKVAGRPRASACEVCGTTGTIGRGIVFDHNHTTRAFRGWLCDNCNKVIGLTHEKPETLRRLADYVEAHGKSRGFA